MLRFTRRSRRLGTIHDMGTVEMLRAAGVGTGDEVIVPAFGNTEVAEDVVRAGAVPVFADIHPETYCIDPSHVAAGVSARTAAVVAVHRFGHRADLARLRELGRRHGLLVLEEPGSPRSRTTRWLNAACTPPI